MAAVMIHPVADMNVRVLLVESETAAGRAPSSSQPLYVHRANAPIGFELEVTEDGGAWRPVNSIGRDQHEIVQDKDEVVYLNASGAGTVTFPVAFVSYPRVTFTLVEGAGAVSGTLVGTPQPTGFNFRVRGANGIQLGAAGVRLNWIAVGIATG